MNDVIEYGMRPDGLGIILIEFCFLLSTNKPINAIVPKQNHILYDLKRIFNISDNQLTITHIPDSTNHPSSSDLLKTFSPYYTPDTVNLFGRQLLTNKRNKPCIGLAMHHGSGLNKEDPDLLGETLAVKKFPFNKYATYDTYSKIIKLVTNAGYDVITFNNRDVDVEHKTFLMNELCECVIGYEGGAAHLAHMLKIPTIILPWNYWYDGDDHWKDGSPWDPDRLESHKFHLDRKTYFLKSQQEIVNWDINHFRNIIDSLHNNNGNHVLCDDQLIIHTEDLKIDIPAQKNVFGDMPAATIELIKQHIKDIKIF